MFDAPSSGSSRSIPGFTTLSDLPIGELSARLTEIVHDKSGAKIVHLAADDPENLFCISFATHPPSSNGVAHILEHTVLCGSRKYPVKDPFFAMMRRSLNTFMNAFTGQDFTCYPASTLNRKDFYHLLDVYLDAVFFPLLAPHSFLQEGHRLEFADPAQPEGLLQYKGIVYNEMKGAMASPDSRLHQQLSTLLFPTLPYRFNSGGDPQEIVHLTYDELVSFHAQFYHPSRALFFFYGNFPLEGHLEKLLPLLDRTERLAPLPRLPVEKKSAHLLSAVGSYPSTAQETGCYVAIGWLTAPIEHQDEILALSLLDILWMGTDASFLKKALIESKLCREAASHFDTEMRQAPYALICKGCREQDAATIRQLVLDSLSAFSPSHDQIEAALHQLEFDRTEIGGGGGPFGLTLFFRAALPHQHGAPLSSGLLIHTLFAKLRASLADPSYLPQLIRRYFLDSHGTALLVLKPDPDLTAREEAVEKEALAQMKDQLSLREKRSLVRRAEELAAFQEKLENAPLDCLPKLHLSDIPPEPLDFSLTQTQAGNIPLFFHDCFTNNILYTDLVFDLPPLTEEEQIALSLYARIATECGTGGRTWSATLEEMQRVSGGIGTSLSPYVLFPAGDRLRPALIFRGKALQRNAAPFFHLLDAFSRGADFSDLDRLKTLVEELASSLQNGVVKQSMGYAIQESLSPFSNASHLQHLWSGLPFFRAIKQWAASSDYSRLSRSLSALQDKLLSSQPTLILSASSTQRQEMEKESFFGVGERPSRSPPLPWSEVYPLPPPSSRAYLIPSPVSFISWGMKAPSYTAPLLLGADLMDHLCLHPAVREKGGAYGVGATYSPASGTFHFHSFRDPHLAPTIAAFQQALEQIGDGSFTSEDLEEAKLSAIQSLDAPVPPASRAMTGYGWLRTGRTLRARQQFRRELLDATADQVASAIRTHLTPAPKALAACTHRDILTHEPLSLTSPPTDII